MPGKHGGGIRDGDRFSRLPVPYPAGCMHLSLPIRRLTSTRPLESMHPATYLAARPNFPVFTPLSANLALSPPAGPFFVLRPDGWRFPHPERFFFINGLAMRTL